MEEKSQKQAHQERVSGVQSALTRLLKIAKNMGLEEGARMTGKDGNLVVSISILPIGSRVGNLYADVGPIITVKTKYDEWGFEYDPTTGTVIDTTEFFGEDKRSGRIHYFTYSGIRGLEKQLQNLKSLVNNVHEWKLA